MDSRHTLPDHSLLDYLIKMGLGGKRRRRRETKKDANRDRESFLLVLFPLVGPSESNECFCPMIA